ncbi:MAG: hypothetical protein ACYTG7_10240 [Planctomycetota bacterium]|jgi:hypothetical protein
MRTIQKLIVPSMMFLLVALCAISFARADEEVWVVEPLPADPAWFGTYGNDINDWGLIGGLWKDGDAQPHPAYWICDEYFDVIETLGAPPGYEDAYGAVITTNNFGLMCGGVWHGPYDQIAMLWNLIEGTYEILHIDGMIASHALGLNFFGDACGFVVEPFTGFPGVKIQGYFWSRYGNNDQVLSPGDYVWSYGVGVNAFGTVCGYVYSEFPFFNPNSDRAVIWKQKSWFDKEKVMLDIHPYLEALDPNVVASRCYDIHDDGVVVGRVTIYNQVDDVYESKPFMWTEWCGASILDCGGYTNGIAYRADFGKVTGRIGDRDLEGDQDAAVWKHGYLDVIPDLPGYPISVGSGINMLGMVVGAASAPDDPGRPDDPAWPRGWIAKKVELKD